MLAQIGKTAQLFHKGHDEIREISLLSADGAVHGGPDDLGLKHIRQGGNGGGQNAGQEKPLGAPEKLPQKGELLIGLVVGFHW